MAPRPKLIDHDAPAPTPAAKIKLTDDQRDEINKRLGEGEQLKALADEYGVSYGVVQVINAKRKSSIAKLTGVPAAPSDSPLRQTIYQIGLLTVRGQSVPANMLDEARHGIEQIVAERVARAEQEALDSI